MQIVKTNGSVPTPAQKIGIIGAGQLARMMIPPAIELGLEVSILAIDPEESAAQVSARTSMGHHTDEDAVLAFARGMDVVTFDHEHVPQSILTRMEAEGIAVYPGSRALMFAQNKLLMREEMTRAGFPCPPWWKVTSEAEVESALEAAGGELVLKTPTGGYDGHGVQIITSAYESRDWLGRTELLAEAKVPFVRELSAQVARRTDGEAVAYPVVESLQKDGVCFLVNAPAPGLDETRQREIQDLATRIAHHLGVVGMLAIELFELADGTVWINELAMRPHNTGHWSMDGAVTGQFEQHLRAVASLPLGSTAMRGEAVMVNLLGGTRTDLREGAQIAMRTEPALKLHLYGKGVRPGRKLGHVTLVGEDGEDMTRRALAAAEIIVNEGERQ